MTVSRVLSGKGGNKVSAELVCRIRKAAAKAGYHENRLAKAMRTGKAPLSALCLHRLPDDEIRNSYWLKLMSCYTQVLFEQQQETLFIPYTTPEELKIRLTSLSAAGLISSAAANIMPGRSAEVTDAMQSIRLPYVLLGNPEDKTVPYSYVDNSNIGNLLLEMLREDGVKELIWFREDMPLPERRIAENPEISFQVSSIAGFCRLNRLAKVPESRIFIVSDTPGMIEGYSGFLVQTHTEERCRNAWRQLELQSRKQPVPDELKVIPTTPADITRIRAQRDL